jgi:hypothetical protein
VTDLAGVSEKLELDHQTGRGEDLASLLVRKDEDKVRLRRGKHGVEAGLVRLGREVGGDSQGGEELNMGVGMVITGERSNLYNGSRQDTIAIIVRTTSRTGSITDERMV